MMKDDGHAGITVVAIIVSGRAGGGENPPPLFVYSQQPEDAEKTSPDPKGKGDCHFLEDRGELEILALFNKRDKFRRGIDLELTEYVVLVGLDRPRRNVQPVGDFLVLQSFAAQAGDIHFT